jgi:anti-sigma factor RsiW
MNDSQLRARIAVLEAEIATKDERFKQFVDFASLMTSTLHRNPDALGVFEGHLKAQKQAQLDREATENTVPAWQRRAERLAKKP